MTDTKRTMIVDVQEDENGELFLQFPDDLMEQLGWKEGDFPEAERIGRNICTLPLFPAMADSDVDRVCAAASRVLSEPNGH